MLCMEKNAGLKTWTLAASMVATLCGSGVQAETLAEVFALAERNDSLLLSQQATYRADRESANISRAPLLPQLNFTGAYTSVENEDQINDVTIERDSENYDVTLSQTLFNLQTWHNYKQGKKIAEQAQAQLVNDEQDLILRVVKAYTDVLSAIDTYNTAKASEAAIARQLEQTRQRFEVGLVAVTEVYESQSTYDNAVVISLNAKGAIGIAFEALETLTGQPIETIAPLIQDFAVNKPEPEARDEWVNLALSNNAQLKVRELAMASALQGAKAKRAAHYPTVTGSYQVNNNDTNYDPANPALDSDIHGDVAAITLNVPIFSGLGVSASRRQAWERYVAASELHANTRRTTIQETRSLHLAVLTDVARVAAQQQAIVSAQSALDATKAGYDAGTRNIVDVLNAEQALYQAKNNWYNSRYQYINNMLSLKKASGTLLPEEVAVFSQATDAVNQLARADFE